MGTNDSTSKPKVHISPDGLEARISFGAPRAGEAMPSYSTATLLSALKDSGVIFGINQETVATLAANPVADRAVIVATGKDPVEGTPGYFEYHFDLSVDRTPKIRDDGTTDYMNIKVIEVVHEGDVIVTYHKAVQGTRGMTVTGKVLEPKNVRDLPPISGRGFSRSADGETYIASSDGKIEMNGNRILISPVYEISEDVGISIGNVDFNGDVVIRGGVSEGAIVRAAGNITIEGLVENCELYAGKDIFLLSGVKGGEKTIIEAGGALTAQFVEYAIVTTKGNILADYIFKSKVSCDGRIDLNGNKAAIIGGYTSAVQGITVREIGNDFGTITNISVGVDQERLAAVEALSRRIEALSANITKIKKGLEEFEKLGKERGINYQEDPRRLQLLRVKIRDEAVVLEEQGRLDEMKSVIDQGGQASIKVMKTVYSGSNLSIDSHHANIKDNQDAVEFVKTPSGIKMEQIEEK